MPPRCCPWIGLQWSPSKHACPAPRPPFTRPAPPCCARRAGQSVGGEEEEGSDWGERDTEPTPLRRPKRFEDFTGEAPPALGRGRGPSPGTVEGAEDAAAREQRRQQARVDAVVKKLQGQGAQVGAWVQAPGAGGLL